MRNTSAATILYGKTGTGKTTLLCTLAEWVWERHGLKSRMVTTEPGGFGDWAVALVNGGVLSILRAKSRDPEGKLGLAIGTMQRLSLGWWPQEIDPETGNMPEGGVLEPPTFETWSLLCQNGHTVRQGDNQAALVPGQCPTCRAPTNQQSGKVVRTQRPNPRLAGFGAWFCDSLTSSCEWCMADVNSRAAKGTLGGIKGALNTVFSDGMEFGSAGMSGVGFVQDRVPQWSANSTLIPGLVVPPVWTAGELRVTGELERPVYGPAIVGQAKTEIAPRWFGNCLNAATVPGDSKREEWRLYLREWVQEGDEARRPAKVRALPGLLPAFLQDKERGSFKEFNLGFLFGMLEGVQGKADERVRKLLEGRPLEGGEEQGAMELDAAPPPPPPTPSAPPPPAPAPAAPLPARAAAAPVRGGSPRPPMPQARPGGTPLGRPPLPRR